MAVMTNGKFCCFSSCDEDMAIKAAQGWRELSQDEIESAGMAGYEHLVSPNNSAVVEDDIIQFTIPTVPLHDYKAEAQAALDRSDLVALRCFKAGIAFPPEWVAYCEALREIVRTGEGPLPEQPEYPQGS